MDQRKDRAVVHWAPFAAGILAGASGTIVGHPFDTLKTRFQVGKVLQDHTLNRSFVGQLYRGIMPPLLTTGAIQSVNFFLFEHFRHWLHNKNSDTQLIKSALSTIFVAGTMSGSVVSLVTNPISIVKIRQQIVAAESIRKCMSDIHRTSGIQGFYRGYKTMLLLDASRGLYLTIYEVMKRLVVSTAAEVNRYTEQDWGSCGIPLLATTSSSGSTVMQPGSSVNSTNGTSTAIPVLSTSTCDTACTGTDSSTSTHNNISNINAIQTNSTSSSLYFTPNSTGTRMLAAATTGIISWIIIFPIDVIRVRLHLDFSRVKYHTWRDCVTKTWAEGGVRAFYRGIGYTVIRAGPVSAASLTTYEYSKDLFERTF